jgi:hypothetical protein
LRCFIFSEEHHSPNAMFLTDAVTRPLLHAHVLGVDEMRRLIVAKMSLSLLVHPFRDARLIAFREQRAALLLTWYMQQRRWRQWRHPRLTRAWDVECEMSPMWLGTHVEFFIIVWGPGERNRQFPLSDRTYVCPFKDHRQAARFLASSHNTHQHLGYAAEGPVHEHCGFACGVVIPCTDDDMETYNEYLGMRWHLGRIQLCPGQYITPNDCPGGLVVHERYDRLRPCESCVLHRQRETNPRNSNNKAPATWWCDDDEKRLSPTYVPRNWWASAPNTESLTHPISDSE